MADAVIDDPATTGDHLPLLRIGLVMSIGAHIDRLLNPRNKATDLRSQFFRYLIVGGAAFVADFLTLILMKEGARLHYVLAATIGFLVGLTINYLLSVGWVFNQRAVSNRYAEFTFFALIGVAGCGLNAAIIWLCTELIGLYYLNSKLVATGLVLFFNFGTRKALLFNPKPSSQPIDTNKESP